VTGNPLVLSLFPGIGLFDMAFEQEGFCIVRGPDLLWGGDVRQFRVPPGRFDGVIGGPPCQRYGGLANFAHRWRRDPEHLIPEFERIVTEARPRWFVMENVPTAPRPVVAGYQVYWFVLNNRWLGEEQSRKRAFSFGSDDGRPIRVEVAALESVAFAGTVTSANGGRRKTHAGRASGGRIQAIPLAAALRLQGCPADFFGPTSPFTRRAQKKMIAEGVPLPMGRAIARAVKLAAYNGCFDCNGTGRVGYINEEDVGAFAPCPQGCQREGAA
jgi:DNA (cytosine-5)-methyltransferase 1